MSGRLTAAQRRALTGVMRYSDVAHCSTSRAGLVSTVRALRRLGYIEIDPREGRWRVTAAGRAALDMSEVRRVR